MDSILEMRDISKSFPGVKALSRVNLKVKRGEIHALVGENGAGKSTLMKVLSGVYPFGSYEGDIVFDCEVRRFRDINSSEDLGIIIIHQELALVPLLSIAENLFIGNEVARYGVINWPEVFSKAAVLMQKVGLNENPATLVTNIGVGKQQLVEIAKALSKNVKVLILDEPTASLNENDSKLLLNLLLEFKSQGITSIIISHKLNEVSYVADTITVLRDGSTVDTMDCHAAHVSEDRIIRAMVGREMSDRYPKRHPKISEILFEVKQWNVYHPLHSDRRMVKDVSMVVRRGEIVGIAGLMGAGRTELAMSIFGRTYGQKMSGQIYLNGKAIDVSTVGKAVEHGIAYVTEDRKLYGLVLTDTIKHNVPMANYPGVADHGVIDETRELDVAKGFRERLNIRSSSVFQLTGNLSGGNQQKVVLSKWLYTDPELLILDEPTRGIDVGAKYEIYCIINELAEQGKGIIVISSEMPEILGISDRIYVMNEGAFVAEIPTERASQEVIMRAIMKRQTAGEAVQ